MLSSVSFNYKTMQLFMHIVIYLFYCGWTFRGFQFLPLHCNNKSSCFFLQNFDPSHSFLNHSTRELKLLKNQALSYPEVYITYNSGGEVTEKLHLLVPFHGSLTVLNEKVIKCWLKRFYWLGKYCSFWELQFSRQDTQTL